MGRGSAIASVWCNIHELVDDALAGVLPIAAKISGCFPWLFCHSLFLDALMAFPVGKVPFQSTKVAQVLRMPRMSSVSRMGTSTRSTQVIVALGPGNDHP
eukprot:4402135-Lingulodinium_polyedra.AAC.1